jgi:hypothetical protein
MNVGIADQEEAVSTAPKPLTRDDAAAQSIEMQASGRQRAVSSAPRLSERTLSVDQFLASETRAVITADAGAGKTTLLRFLALEILSETPEVEAVRNLYAGYIPIWVPFALWCRMAEGRDHSPPLEDVIHAFIKSQSDAAFADDVKRALGDNKVILLVDGLDEARGSAASETVLAGLTTFVEMRGVPMIATSRPHGMRALSAISGSWAKLRLAPLSEAKRDALALLWYRILERTTLAPVLLPVRLKRRLSTGLTALRQPWPGTPAFHDCRLRPCFLWLCSSFTGLAGICHATASKPAKKSSINCWNTSRGAEPRTRSKPRLLSSTPGCAIGCLKNSLMVCIVVSYVARSLTASS